MKKLRLGVIGLSEGNGHPYSWSAIFNGYNAEEMKKSGFPIISEYLSERIYPADFLGEFGTVEQVWTQDISISKQIAAAANISRVASSIEEMLKDVDAVLLARDDGENHLEMVIPILRAGLPVFIDKPFALSLSDANKMLEAQQYPQQIFTCSSLRFAGEFQAASLEIKTEDVSTVVARTPKKWSSYSTHILEPAFAILNDWTPIESFKVKHEGETTSLSLIKESGINYLFQSLGNQASGIELNISSKDKEQVLVFKDSFSAFKSSLIQFINQIHSKKLIIPRAQSLQIVECIEYGMR